MSVPADEKSKPFRRLPRSFSLKRKSLIRPLFDPRREDVGSLSKGCIRIVYRLVSRKEVGSDVPLQVGFAPGRIGKAVERNRIKRHLREVYRVHQSDLVGLFCSRVDALTMMVVYRGGLDGSLPPRERIRRDLPPLLRELISRVGETSMSAERRE